MVPSGVIRPVERTRVIGGKRQHECCLYVLSRRMPAKELLAVVRRHWDIENGLHWQLDVVFREEQSRIRCGDAAQNFSTLRRIALNLLKTETAKPKEPIRGKRIFAAVDPAYLESIIGLRQM